jgi:hypothetical protein
MKKTFFRVVALIAALSLATMNMAFAGGSIGHGNISVYKDNTLVSKLSGQNPIEDGTLLVCDGKCMLKSEGISVIAEDKSKIAVKNDTDTFRLYVKEGIVDYIINSNARKIAFYTPQGTYTVAEVVFNASSTPAVKGRVVVDSDGNTEISVTEGRMVFATSEGMKTVDANHKIVLAQAPQTSSTNYWLIGGVLAVAVVAGIAIADNNDDNDDDSIISSFQPSVDNKPPIKKKTASPHK